MSKQCNYKNNAYSIVYVGDGRASFIVNGAARFFGCNKAAEYFFNLAETNPECINW